MKYDPELGIFGNIKKLYSERNIINNTSLFNIFLAKYKGIYSYACEYPKIYLKLKMYYV